MNVLITGGFGCIGAWIIKNLLEKQHSICVFDIKQDNSRLELILSASEIAKVKYVSGDVTDVKALTDCLHKNEITHIIHLAGLQVPTCRANPILGATVNVIGTLAVFESILALKNQIQQLVYASSAAVFGAPNRYPTLAQEPLSDDSPLYPSTHYGYFKCCNEGNAKIYYQDFGISSIGLRPWTVYGVGRDLGMTSEPTKAIKSVALNRPYHINYGGFQDLQLVDDVAKTFVRCLEVPYKGAKSYNMRGAVVDLPTFCQTLYKVEPSAAKLITHGDQQIAIAYNLDDQGLENDLGPMPKTPLSQGIETTLKMFQSLHQQGKLSTTDLETAKPKAVVLNEA